MSYLPHQQRVVDEKRDLDEKRTKLLEFIQNSPIFKNLGESDRMLLTEQLEVMTHYSVILGSRIDRF
jgi:hypothetical protein